MRLRISALLIALIVGPAHAATPGNNVHCIYDQLSPEDLEIATIMTMDVVGRDKDDAHHQQAAKEVETLVYDPYIFCSDKYPWGYVEITNARHYVITRLLSTAAVELLLIFGKDPAVIDGYFAQNRVPLLKLPRLGDRQMEQLVAHLEAQGWGKEKKEPVAVGASYFMSLWMLEKLTRAFDKSELFDPSDS